ncbi:E3 ubiquitin-protein ligase rad18 [Mortierella polycephala]|uniref:E3 ubiquitin-protein ligase rad18 n=1 Tax=Mortierella polycephala TaxID=41804 RepID=A0A9P6Q6M6_9FUNG|nr:E3 ubiquitin-protein ligase rad18 [Mortierella polycephala]
MDADDFSSRQLKRRRTSTRITRATSNLSSQEHSYGMPQDDDDKDEDFVMPSQESTSAHKGKNVTHYSSGPTLEPRSGREVTPNNIQESSTSQQTLAAVPPTPSSTSSTPPSAPSTPTKTNHTLVPCPVCQMSVPEAYANTHLDKYCFVGKGDPAYTLPHSLMIAQGADIIALYERQGTSKQAVVGASPKSSPQRNGTINSLTEWNVTTESHAAKSNEEYRIETSISGTEKELGLPSHGDKQLMQKRHAEYVTIYNANCDSTRPQTTAQLMKAMDAWERSYEMDMQAKEAQRRAQEKQQRLHQEHQKQMAQHAAAAAVANSSDVSSSPSSTPSSSQSNIPTGSSSSGFVPNQTNNNETAVAIASASAFAHALKYADEYAELIADVKRRQAADKEKTLVDKNEPAVNDPQQGTTSSQS